MQWATSLRKCELQGEEVHLAVPLAGHRIGFETLRAPEHIKSSEKKGRKVSQAMINTPNENISITDYPLGLKAAFAADL